MNLHYLPILALALLTAAHAAEWRTGAPLPVPIGGHAAGVSAGRILLAGGTTWQNGKKYWLRDVRAYDPKLDRWERVGMLPGPIGDPASIDGGNALYLIGGSDGAHASTHCYRLRLAAPTQGATGSPAPRALATDRLPDLPDLSVYAAGGRIGSSLYVMGGGSDPNDLGTATNALLALDLTHLDRGWQGLPPLPGPARLIHTAAPAGRFLYVFGGCFIDDKKVVRNLADAYRYDTHAHQWERLPDMPVANRGLTALATDSRHVLLFGGFTATEEECAGQGDAFGFTDQVLSYDTIARTYTPLVTLPTPTCSATPVLLAGNIYLLGGEPVKRQRGNWVWIRPS